jgi:hypothetical protein
MIIDSNDGEYYDVDFCCSVGTYVPKTYKQAVSCPDAERWKEAMDDEITSLHENDTYEVVPLPAGKQVVGGRWVFAVKATPGGVERYKARYVAQGFSQQEGRDYFETFAPTAKMTSVRMLMQIAADFDLTLHQLDVRTAYLNAPLDCEIYMNQPKGYELEEPAGSKVRMVCRLQKSLYGLKQSGRMWNLVLHNFLKEKGFIQSPHDPCTYVYSKDNDIAIVIVWVDDMLVAGNSGDCVDKVKGYLKKRFRMSDLGPISFFLGINFTQDGGVITMDQTEYFKTKIKKFRMEASKPRSTPSEIGGYEQENTEPYDNIPLF